MPQNPSRIQIPSRLRNYVTLAATPAVTMSMSISSASADIVYESLDISFDIGQMSTWASSTFSVGGFASAAIVAFPFGSTAWGWVLTRSEDKAGSLFFAHRTSGIGTLVRFAAGEVIASSAFHPESTQDSVGGWAGGGTTLGDLSVDFKVADGTASGYVGFAVVDSSDRPLFGWLSVSWNDATQVLSLDGYAYETDGSGIVAGAGLPPAVPAAPGALGLVALAAGAAGVRRQRAC